MDRVFKTHDTGRVVLTAVADLDYDEPAWDAWDVMIEVENRPAAPGIVKPYRMEIRLDPGTSAGEAEAALRTLLDSPSALSARHIGLFEEAAAPGAGLKVWNYVTYDSERAALCSDGGGARVSVSFSPDIGPEHRGIAVREVIAALRAY